MGEYPVGSFPHRILIAEGQVFLPVALGQFNGPVVVGVEKSIVGHVVYIARAAAAVEIALEIRVNARPHLDARAIGGIGHGGIVNVDVLYDIKLLDVLAQRPNRDAMRAIAVEALDNDVGAVGLKGNAVIPVIDD